MKIAVGDVELFFDVEGPKVVASGDAWVERPTVVLLPRWPGRGPLALQGSRRPAARLGRAGRLPRPAGRRPQLPLGLRRAGTSRRGRRPARLSRRARDRAPGAPRQRDRLARRAQLRLALPGAAGGARAGQRRRALRPPAVGLRVRPARRRARRRGGGAVLRRSDRGDVRRLPERLPAALHAAARSTRTSSRAWHRTRRRRSTGTAPRPRTSISARRLGWIACPVLLFAGEDDPSFTLAGAEELAERRCRRS